MEITDLIPFLGDTVVFIVLAYVVWLFVDGRILSQKAMERITTAIIVEITTRIDETLAANFIRLSKEEQILNEIKGLHSDDEIRQKLTAQVCQFHMQKRARQWVAIPNLSGFFQDEKTYWQFVVQVLTTKGIALRGL